MLGLFCRLEIKAFSPWILLENLLLKGLKIDRIGIVKKIMPAAFAELQGDYLYMLTTPSREEMEQMIKDFGQRQE